MKQVFFFFFDIINKWMEFFCTNGSSYMNIDILFNVTSIFDELWAGDNAKRMEVEKKVADHVVDAEVKVNAILLAELQQQFANGKFRLPPW